MVPCDVQDVLGCHTSFLAQCACASECWVYLGVHLCLSARTGVCVYVHVVARARAVTSDDFFSCRSCRMMILTLFS